MEKIINHKLPQIKTILSTILCALFFLQNALTQGTVLGAVSDAKGPLAYANVLLLKSADSSLVRGEVTGEDGAFAFNHVIAGSYLLSTTMVGYHANYRSFVLAAGNDFAAGNITMNEDVTQLGAVTVTAKKQLFEQMIDRLVVNVEGSITAAGTTALAVLERSPGVVVNRQSNAISVAGKDGVIVMINGKANRMPMAAVVQLLEGMPSGNIEKIEIITTPPAKFDAEGNAGYINIVLKQSSDLGLNGSYSLSMGVGNGTAPSASINFNYRKNKFNLYGDYSFSRQAQLGIIEYQWVTIVDGHNLNTHTRNVRAPSIQRNHNSRLGFDVTLGKKTVLGMFVSGYDNRYSMDSETNTSVVYDGSLDSLLTTHTIEVNHWKHLGSNLNLQHTFGKEGVLTFDADYLHYNNDQPADYEIDYANGAGVLNYSEQTLSRKETPINVAVGRLDYAKQLAEKTKMNVGVKGTISRFDNNVAIYYFQNGSNVNDPELSGKYRLEERIGAAYSAFDVALSAKTSMKLGLRYEYTNSNLGTVDLANIVDRQYGRFFPSFFLSHTLNDNNSTNFSYSRRITRPAYNDMAPFVFFFDPFTFYMGNPDLQPSISNNLKLDYRFKTALFSAQYSMEDDAISGFQFRIIEGTNKQTLGIYNMKNRETASFTVAFPMQVAKWWDMQNNFTGTWQEINTYIGEDLATVSAKSYQIVWTNSFKLPRDFSAELVSFYQSKSLFGYYFSLPMRSVNIGLQKKLKNDLGTLRFGIDDLFDSMQFRWDSNIPEYNLTTTGRLDFNNRTYKLTFSRNFGNSKLKGARQRSTGSEEERGRVNG